MVVASCGGRWALRAGIGMTINFPVHPMSVAPFAQCYLAVNNTHVIRVVYSFASFPSVVIFMFRLHSL